MKCETSNIERAEVTILLWKKIFWDFIILKLKVFISWSYKLKVNNLWLLIDFSLLQIRQKMVVNQYESLISLTIKDHKIWAH